jgi:drug/metabolite transporter superfamily protein YnfA
MPEFFKIALLFALTAVAEVVGGYPTVSSQMF